MRLVHCRLRNVRIHGELSLDFAPGLTMVGGANETGKSTLLQALHRTLFLKATARGSMVEELGSRTHKGIPTVDLEFEARGRGWQLHKEFSGGSRGQVQLQRAPGGDGPVLRGPEAEAELAKLLEEDGPLDGRTAGSSLKLRWAHLWVEQGRAGANPLQDQDGRQFYPLEQLIQQLEKRGGAALQSPLDQQVADAIDELLKNTFTKTGKSKKHSSLGEAEEKEAAAEDALEQAKQLVEEDKNVSDELSQVYDKLDNINGQLSNLKKQLPHLRLLQSRYTPQRKELENCGETVKRLGQDQRSLRELTRKEQEQQVEHRQLQEKDKAFTQQLDSAQQTKTEYQQQHNRLREREVYLESQMRQLQWRKDRKQLRQQIQELERQKKAQDQLQKSLGGLPQIKSNHLKELRRLESDQRDCQTRQDGMAAEVELIRANQEVRLDGQPLNIAQPRQLTKLANLHVGDVVVRISPGGDQVACAQAWQKATQALNEKLEQFNVASVEAADEVCRQRQALEQQLNMHLQQANPQKLQHLQKELAQVDSQLQGLVQDESGPADLSPIQEESLTLDVLKDELLKYQETSQQIKAQCKQAEADLKKAEGRINAIAKEQVKIKTGLQVLAAEQRSCSEQKGKLLANYGTSQDLEDRFSQAEEEQTKSQDQLDKLQQQLHDFMVPEDKDDPSRALNRLEHQEAGLQKQQNQQLSGKGELLERRRGISRKDPTTTLEKAQAAWAQAQEDLEQEQQRGEALKLLKELFSKAHKDLSTCYTKPLAKAIGNYLEPLLSEDQEPICQVNYNQDEGLTGLKLRRNQDFHEFAQLSGGTREQLSAALRLAMADILKDRHDHCLPLIFDDAFTNTDPERIPMVSKMLHTAVANGLQVILLTCDPQVYDGSLKPDKKHYL